MADTDGAAEEAFDRMISAAADSVWVVTTVSGEHRAGCLVGFAAQVGIEPRRFLACLSKVNHTYRVAAGASHLAVHLVADDALPLAQLFAAESGFEVDKFEHCGWRHGPLSLPILTGAAAWFAGTILDRIDFGDHVGFLLDPLAAHPPAPGIEPLRYTAVAGLEPGNQP